MEYYDSIDNTLLYSHYSNRNIKMLTNPEVVSLLDHHGLNQLASSHKKFSELNDSPYKIISNFKTDTYGRARAITDLQINKNIFKSNTLLSKDSGFDSSLLSAENLQNLVNVQMVNKIQKRKRNDEIKLGIGIEVSKLNVKMTKIEDLMRSDINFQKDSFEERKKKKLEKANRKQRQSRRFMVRKGSKLDEILIAVVARGLANIEANNETTKNEILQGVKEIEEKKFKNKQLIMNKEIDDFIVKNMTEMNKSIEELRVSFEEEIKCIDDVFRGMKDDMEVELENLKEQYDEHRSEGVEKIKSKHNIKK